MASAEREPTRAPARVESESVGDQHLGAGGCTVSLASRRFHRAEVAHDPADRPDGAGLRGGNYAYPIGVHDYLAWSAGQQAQGESQQGNERQQRLRYLVSFRLTPRFARPLWDRGA
jgi:hypothetical protein